MATAATAAGIAVASARRAYYRHLRENVTPSARHAVPTIPACVRHLFVCIDVHVDADKERGVALPARRGRHIVVIEKRPILGFRRAKMALKNRRLAARKSSPQHDGRHGLMAIMKRQWSSMTIARLAAAQRMAEKVNKHS